MQTSAIDLFCGIGGLSFGLKKSGISVIAGIDVDETCKYAFEKNIGAKFLSKDIADFSGTEIKEKFWPNNEKIRILVGCAPCQPFSTHANKIKDKKSNKKWHLLNEFIRIALETMPEIISMENVPNLANQQIFKDFEKTLIENGYFVNHSNIFCPDYGIPQKRRRLVLLASRFGNISIVAKTHQKSNFVTLKQAIGNLPKVQAGEICKVDSLHRSSNLSLLNLKRIKASKPNGTWLDWDEEIRLECHKKVTGNTYKAVYGRMSWNEPSSTITTQFINYGTGRFGHPIQDRALTIREGAILQTFPSDYKFSDPEEPVSIKRLAVQIGNAVPVDLGLVIGQSILKHLGELYDR